MPDKAHVLAEIQRTAQANGGKPLGRGRFLAETGIREADWSGRYWARWSDALREAGFAPNELQARRPDDQLLGSLAALVRELGHFPTEAELRLKRRNDIAFPSSKTFARYGHRSGLVAALRDYCQRTGDGEVLSICSTVRHSAPVPAAVKGDAAEEFGEVYLLRSGRFYKIGRTVAVGRRARELAIQLPEKAVVMHTIRTDDPLGIEEYWHRRFASQRKNGEWFDLSAADIQAFRRRKFM